MILPPIKFDGPKWGLVFLLVMMILTLGVIWDSWFGFCDATFKKVKAYIY